MIRQAEAQPRVRDSRLSRLESAAEAYELQRTLQGYEVEELDGHDLSRVLPTLISSENTEQTPEPTSS